MVGVKGIPSVAVKCVDIGKNTRHSETKAKGANGIRYPSSLGCKRWILDVARIDPCSIVANALSIPPGK